MLIEKCNEIREFLKNENEATWYAIFDSLIEGHLDESDDRLARAVLRLYGGMGSFNDLVIGRTAFELTARVNERLNELRQELFDIATGEL